MRSSTRATSTTMCLVVALLVAACGPGGDQPSANSGDEVGTTTAADSVPGDDASGPDESTPGFGTAIEISVTLGGAIAQTYIRDDETDFVLAGGCMGDTFGVQLQVLDTTVEALGGGSGVTALNLTAGIDADLSGGTTGSFELDDLSVEVFEEPGDLTTSNRFRGPGFIDISTHDAPNDLQDRRMHIAITGEGLVGDEGDQLDVRAEAIWVMGCP